MIQNRLVQNRGHPIRALLPQNLLAFFHLFGITYNLLPLFRGIKSKRMEMPFIFIEKGNCFPNPIINLTAFHNDHFEFQTY